MYVYGVTPVSHWRSVDNYKGNPTYLKNNLTQINIDIKGIWRGTLSYYNLFNIKCMELSTFI